MRFVFSCDTVKDCPTEAGLWTAMKQVDRRRHRIAILGVSQDTHVFQGNHASRSMLQGFPPNSSICSLCTHIRRFVDRTADHVKVLFILFWKKKEKKNLQIVK